MYEQKLKDTFDTLSHSSIPSIRKLGALRLVLEILRWTQKGLCTKGIAALSV